MPHRQPPDSPGPEPTPRDFADLPATLAELEPLPRARTVPSAWFVEPRFDRLDREAVFARSWQAVGRIAELPEPGSWFPAEVAGEPVIVVRGRDDAVRGFFNVCRHRGGPLAMEPGCGRVLKCRYHGWTYTLEGTLRGVPQWDRVELFDREDYGLLPVRVEEWQGLPFANLDPKAAPLRETFEDVAERMAPLRLDDLVHQARVAYDVACNWKVYVENFLEGYHVPIVHPELVRLYDYTRYETVVSRHWSLQSSPLDDSGHAYAPGGGEALYYCVFPNFMLNVLPGRVQTNLVIPTGPGTCRVLFDYYYADVASEAGRARSAADMAFAHEVQGEDIEICEHVQRGLASRAYDRGRFSVKFEAGVHWFQRRLTEAYADWLEDPRPVTPPPVLDPKHEP